MAVAVSKKAYDGCCKESYEATHQQRQNTDPAVDDKSVNRVNALKSELTRSQSKLLSILFLLILLK